MVTATLAVAVVLAGGCVETAECNESVSCSNGRICYRFECRQICETDAQCGDGQTCRPCKEPGSEENRCFGASVRACVPDS